MKHNKFSVAEMFSNSSKGKTSIGKVVGTVVIAFGLLCVIDKKMILEILKNYQEK